LINNAAKHHDKENGIITIDIEEKENQYQISVHDDGPGIEPQYHAKIFEMFQTLKSRDETEGSGMGLAFVRKILTNYGCEITVESRPGQGATFRFTWPKNTNALNPHRRVYA
jgi:signal transduction histidine kinase